MGVRLRSILIVSLFVLGGFAGLLDFASETVAAPPTYISGTVYDGSGGPWIVADSPYIIMGNVTVPDGETLTIEPGVMVKFNGWFQLLVNGRLSSIGTESNMITFTSNKTSPVIGDWWRISINSTGMANIKYCNIMYGDSGIHLNKALHTNITNNILTYNDFGIHIAPYSTYSYIANNTVSFSESVGIWFATPSMIHIYDSFVINNTIVNNYGGLGLSYSANLIIANNTISDNTGSGLVLSRSSDNSITSNNISRNKDGIIVYASPHNNFDDNHFWNNDEWNFYVYTSDFPLGPVGDFDISVSTSNTVNGNPIYYFYNIQDFVIEGLNPGHITVAGSKNVTFKDSVITNGDPVQFARVGDCEIDNVTSSFNYAGIVVEYSSDITIQNNEIFWNRYSGIWLLKSNFNRIIQNNISENERYGLYLVYSSNNTISNNTIFSNDFFGFYFWSTAMQRSMNNRIYHNNFISNLIQANDIMGINYWNTTYPYGGNYWSDYSPTCLDLYDGQVTPQLTGSPDGICDIPYNVDPDSVDYYPLKGPSSPPAILSTVPTDASTNVDINQDVVITFSSPINVSTFTYEIDPDPGGWTWTWSGSNTTARGSHDYFMGNTSYTFNVTAAEDLSGNPLSPGGVPNPWTWTTAVFSVDISPSNGAIDVPLNEPIVITFSGIDPKTLPLPWWSISGDPGLWLTNFGPGYTVTLIHMNPFEPCTTYFFSLIMPGVMFPPHSWTTICPPALSVYEPGGSPDESFMRGDIVNVIWNATDDNPFPSNPVNISYGDPATGWISVAVNEENDGVYLWDTSSVPCSRTYWMNISVHDSAGLTTYGESNYSFEIICPDTTPPTITDLQPANGATIDDKQPLIGANYSDNTGINTATIILKVDGIDVTSDALITEDGIVYIPSVPLEDGDHTVYLEVCDNSTNQNKATLTWSFIVDTPEGEEPPPTDKDFLSEYWWLLVVIAAVIIILLVILLMMRKRRKGEEIPESEGEEKATHEPKAEDSRGKE